MSKRYLFNSVFHNSLYKVEEGKLLMMNARRLGGLWEPVWEMTVLNLKELNGILSEELLSLEEAIEQISNASIREADKELMTRLLLIDI